MHLQGVLHVLYLHMSKVREEMECTSMEGHPVSFFVCLFEPTFHLLGGNVVVVDVVVVDITVVEVVVKIFGQGGVGYLGGAVGSIGVG